MAERGKALGIGSVVAGGLCILISFLSLIPDMWYLCALLAVVATGIAIAAVLHGERTLTYITPLLVGVGLSIAIIASSWVSKFSGFIGGSSGGVIPLLVMILLMLALVAAPFATMYWVDHGADGGTTFFRQGVTMFAGALREPRPAPADVASANLRLVPKSGGRHQTIPASDLRRGRRFVIGRGDGCDVVFADSSVSRRHAEIAFQNGRGPCICDLGSSGGTYLDGRRVAAQFVPLSGARKLRLGTYELQINPQ